MLEIVLRFLNPTSVSMLALIFSAETSLSAAAICLSTGDAGMGLPATS